jgi:hypothetical protein
MTHLRLLTLALLLATPAALSAQAQPAGRPQSNTSAEPAAILAARSTYQSVEAALKAGRLARQDTTVECEEQDGSAHTIALFRDSARVVRRLTWEGGNDHQAVTRSYYYDAGARLRFAFQQQRVVNGTIIEERVYYDDAGEVARRLRKMVRGPGYSWSEVDAAPDPSRWIREFCQ